MRWTGRVMFGNPEVTTTLETPHVLPGMASLRYAAIVRFLILTTALVLVTPARAKKARHHPTVTNSASAKPSQGRLDRPAGPFDTVVVDAGHGGHDRGGIPENIIPEK